MTQDRQEDTSPPLWEKANIGAGRDLGRLERLHAPPLPRWCVHGPKVTAVQMSQLLKAVCRTNGTSLSPEALPRSACSEVCNHTRCADIAFFSGSPESPFFQPVFASLAQDQLYRDAVAATGSFRCHSGSWLCRIIGFSTSADRHWLRKMFRNWSISSSYALSSNASTTPVHNAIVPSSARAVPLIEDRQVQP